MPIRTRSLRARTASGGLRRVLAAATVLCVAGACSATTERSGPVPDDGPHAAALGTTLATPPGPPPRPPVGVTLRPVDGGPDYFAQWSNSFPTDPSFFPIGVWAETLAGPQDAAAYRRLGINTFAHLWAGPTRAQMDQVAANDMYAVGEPSALTFEPSFDERYGNALAARNFQDEGDGRDVCGDQVAWLAALCRTTGDGRTDPAALTRMADALRAKDPTRPVYGQFTKPVALGSGLDEAQRRAYLAGVDIVSYDWYVLTDPDDPGPVWAQADATRAVRGLTGRTKPVWVFIETSHVFEDSDHRPTPGEVSAEVWNALIGGARGIQYFNHSFKAGLESQHVLIDRRYRAVARAVRETDRRIAELAPVLNAPSAEGLAKVTAGRAGVLAKGYDRSWFLVVAPRSARPQDVTIRIAGVSDATATVLYEDRAVPVSGGRLHDHFDDAETIHIYRITPAG
jgi:hypothetical protein